MNLGIAGRVALVTAGSKGLGRASANALVEEGARVVICGRGADALAQAAQGLTEAAVRADRGGEVHTVRLDVTAPESPKRLVEEALERFGGLHILVANAGGPPPGRAFDVDDVTLLNAINANLLTTIRLARQALPEMRSAGWGRICAIASLYVRQPSPTLVPSNVARTALLAWAKTAAADVAADGVTVNLACPGFHLTDRLRELGGVAAGTRTGTPQDFGKVVAFLCSGPAAFINGVALNVDGGFTVGLL